MFIYDEKGKLEEKMILSSKTLSRHSFGNTEISSTVD